VTPPRLPQLGSVVWVELADANGIVKVRPAVVVSARGGDHYAYPVTAARRSSSAAVGPARKGSLGAAAQERGGGELGRRGSPR